MVLLVNLLHRFEITNSLRRNVIPRGFMRSERTLSVSNVTIKQNAQRLKVVSNVKIKQIIFLHFISGGKS